MRIHRFIILVCAVILLNGCGTQFLKQFAKEVKGFEDRNTVKETPKPSPAVYCYNTLGTVSCYEKPQPKDSEGRYVGTSVEPIDPSIQENQIQGNTALPPVEVDELPVVVPESMTSHTEEAEKDQPAAETPAPVHVEPTAKPAEPQPATQTEPAIAQPDPTAADAPPNRPLYDPYLNQLEEKPVDNTVIKPPPPTVQDPIVPPKKKAKKKNSETK